MKDNDDYHHHPAPGVEQIPSLAGEQKGHAVPWVSPTLVATDGQKEEVDAGEGGQDSADKQQ